MEVVVRPYKHPQDDAYIYSTWTQYAYYSSKEPILIPKKQWFQQKNKEIDFALLHGSVNIACLRGSPSVIMGYIVVLDGKVIWLCVKKSFHHQGIENILIKSIKGKIHEGTIDAQEDFRKRHSGLES